MTNWPNPTNSKTTFTYNLKQACNVTITVVDSFGQLIGKLLDGYQQKGEQRVVWNAEKLSPGMYYIRIEAEGKAASGKVIKL